MNRSAKTMRTAISGCTAGLLAGAAAILPGCAGGGGASDSNLTDLQPGPTINQIATTARGPTCGHDHDGSHPLASGPLTADELASLPALYRQMVDRHQQAPARAGAPVIACFEVGTPDSVIAAFNKAIFQRGGAGQEFVTGTRWTSTALDPLGSAPGQPIRITWSIVPDGTQVDGFTGEPVSPSDFRARLDSLYGDEAAWLPIIQQTFDRWEAVSGIDYVYEPNDDGVPLESDTGVPNVRGDVRLAGHFIDGNSGILAYNFFPNAPLGGDMVLDTADSFYNDLSNGSLGLRNVLTHEFGHGLGMPHICPVEQARLMEPFISRAFDGPRHDDIRHAQFLYGDNAEPNDDSASATDLGALGVCGSVSRGSVPEPSTFFFGNLVGGSLLGVSQGGDEDWYAFSVSGPTRLNATITTVGFPYDSSPQNCPGVSASCCSGTIIDTQADAVLRARVFAADGVTLLASLDGTPGVGIDVSNIALPDAGTYYLVIDDPAATAQSQLYSLDVTVLPGAISIVPVADAFVQVVPGAAPVIAAIITGDLSALDPSSVQLEYRIDASDAITVPMIAQSGDVFEATIGSLPCGATLSYIIRASTNTGLEVTGPCGPGGVLVAQPFVGQVATIFEDDFEINRGWTVGPNTAPRGNWVRVVPVGSAAQPGADNTRGGTFCFVTGQGTLAAAPGVNDLDEGFTVLTSPVFNLADFDDATFTYARWYSNGQGAGPFNDQFRVQVSIDAGATWTDAEILGPGNALNDNTLGGWRNASFSMATLGLVPSATTQLRFLASDNNPQSLVEAAVDDFKVVARSCAQPVLCFVDYNSDGFLNQEDLGGYLTAFLDESVPPGPSGTNFAPCPGEPAPYDALGYAADYNRDCSFNQEDLAGFITDYFAESENPAGCVPG